MPNATNQIICLNRSRQSTQAVRYLLRGNYVKRHVSLFMKPFGDIPNCLGIRTRVSTPNRMQKKIYDCEEWQEKKDYFLVYDRERDVEKSRFM